MTDLATAWSAVHAPITCAVDLARHRNAARVVAQHGDRLTRVLHVRISEAFDWDRLRVNVAHLVAPRMVRGSSPEGALRQLDKAWSKVRRCYCIPREAAL